MVAEYRARMCVVWGAWLKMQNPLFRTRAVLRLHQYTHDGIRRGVGVCAIMQA